MLPLAMLAVTATESKLQKEVEKKALRQLFKAAASSTLVGRN